jgi:hypothetical protein
VYLLENSKNPKARAHQKYLPLFSHEKNFPQQFSNSNINRENFPVEIFSFSHSIAKENAILEQEEQNFPTFSNQIKIFAFQ